jgi:hypothetical protein
MGGWGSGAWQGGKSTTSAYRALDVRRLARDGLLVPGKWFGWNWSREGESIASIQIRVGEDRVTLNYRARNQGEDWQQFDYPVYLDWTGCRLGGRRAWLRCPARGCGRTVAVLYGGTIFACRHCHRLAYDCQRERWDDRLTRRADKIRHRLGWEPGILNGDGGKPKGMHWRTFERLQDRHDAYVQASLAGMMMRFGIASREFGIG